MNKGINLSKGNWLYFLGADDQLFNKDVLKEVSIHLSSDLEVLSGGIQYLFCENDSKHINENNAVFNTFWSWKLWIKNTVHHQSTFYKKSLFEVEKFNTKYNVLADYDFNLKLYKKKVFIEEIDFIIAKCGVNGISKNYNWSLYQEEIKIKTQASSIFYWPLFFKLAILKYMFKKTRFK